MQSIVDTEAGRPGDGFPRFSMAEMARRRARVEALIESDDLDGLILYGADRSGSAVQWLTGWPVTREAVVLVRRGVPDTLWVQFHNHVPTARRLAGDAEVLWGGPSTISTVTEALAARSLRRIGIVGPIRHADHERVAAVVSDVVTLDARYTALRLVKSAEELQWLRVGAEMSDRAILALRDGLVPGVDEYELGALVESAYVPAGGTTHIHYFGVTSMADPHTFVPAQWPTTRRVTAGDVLTTEISASWWGYPGQVLRTMTVSAPPTPEYLDLHDTAEAAYAAVLNTVRAGVHVSELVAASTVIEDAGYTICDDLVHGFGGGYLPPVLGTRSRPAGPIPDMTLEAGMTMVIQPNVITRDETRGVQTGGLVLVTDSGSEELQQVPGGIWQVG